ncbi:hypothetical protein ABEW19_02380 [Paenibacillus illinoisensis]|uniref:hypothetical protein n=1 Tax=Paenibacillus illinoisensis TaxID=59845 RepID=UPI003D2AED5E
MTEITLHIWLTVHGITAQLIKWRFTRKQDFCQNGFWSNCMDANAMLGIRYGSIFGR